MVNSVVKAIAILRTFDREHPLLSIGEISARVGMPKSSVHRLVATLEKAGLLGRDVSSGKYRLGLGLVQLASTALESIDLRRSARPVIERLAAEVRDTVHLAVLDEGDVVYIDKIDSPARIQMISRVGGRAPAHCTGVGKVLLAYLPNDEVRRIATSKGLPAFTPATITNVEELLAHLATIRQRGYAIDQGEHEAMIRCVAAPVRDNQDRVVAAVSVTTIATSWDLAWVERTTALVLQACREISRNLGWPGDGDDGIAGTPSPDGVEGNQHASGLFSEHAARSREPSGL